MNKISSLPKAYKFFFQGFFLVTLFTFSSKPAAAQIFGHSKSTVTPYVDTTLTKALDFRNIGPYRGGRSVAVSGVESSPNTYYTGFTGGGVYKTSDSGETWKNVSDGYFKTGSVGAVATAPSDSNIVYVGMGETALRGNISGGDGMYKSTDAGKTWHHIGLGKTMFIGDIVVHPDNPDILWVAALGKIFGTEGNEERGVYKSTDGGQSWKKVLYNGKHAGAIDIALDPDNPNTLYASLWQVYRSPWFFSSGGPGSGLYKSTDGGNTWENISHREGLPKGTLGIIKMAISPANTNRVYASVENKDGGLFRSDDAGKTWKLVNQSNKIRQRAWYFSDIYADSKDEDVVYDLNVSFHKSTDGGKTFKSMRIPHGDAHDLWINPKNPDRMIVGDDGGGQVTDNGGKNWTSFDKYATGQFYTVKTDNRFPYWVYGAQQDDGSVAIKSRTAGSAITESDWMGVAGGEAGYIIPDPDNPNITYGGGQENRLYKYNSVTKQRSRIDVWPMDPTGWGAAELKHRFQWTYPVYISPHNSKELYVTSQYVNRSMDGGNSWEIISPDLTRNDKSKQQSSGGPITQDNNGPEYYDTIFSFEESPVTKGVLWAGADDGLVHVSRDNGDSWKEVTPEGMPQGRVNMLEASPHDAGTAYIAVTRYKFGDFQPMLYKTHNYGKSWTKIINGIPAKDFTRVIREDPHRKGLLFAGTETGLYVSFNDGAKWQRLQLNLPIMPVTDMTIQKRDNDLVVATQGRAFWILDELGVLEQMNDKVISSDNYLFRPEDTYLFGRRGYGSASATVGENPEHGVVVYYKLTNPGNKEVQLQFLEDDGTVIHTYSSKEEKKESKANEEEGDSNEKKNPDKLSAHNGTNKFVWNMQYRGATEVNRPQVFWGGSLDGPRAIPGTYKVRMIVDGQKAMEQPFVIKKDPRIDTSQEDFVEQFEFRQKILAKLDTVQKSINKIIDLRNKIDTVKSKGSLSRKDKEIINSTDSKLDTILNNLMQTKSVANEDPLGYKVRLADRLAVLSRMVGSGDRRPPKQTYEVYGEVAKKVDVQLEKLNTLLKGEFGHLMGEMDIKSVPIGH